MVLPLIPVVGFGLLVTWFVIYGMHRGNQDWLLPLLNALAHPQGSFLKRIVLKPVSLAAAAISWIVSHVDHALSVAASHTIAPVAHWIHGIAAWISHVFWTAEHFAEATAHAFERLTAQTIPRAIHKAVAPVAHTARLGLREADLVAHRLRVYARGIDRLLHNRVLPGLRAVERAIDITIPRALGRIRTRVGTLEHDLTHPSRAWLKRLARSMWAVALFGLLIRTLARRFPWLFCRKVKSVGNRVCGLDTDLLNTLLLDTLLISGTVSIVQVARELQTIEGAAVGLLRDFIDEF